MLFSNRGEKVSMSHFKEIEIGFTNTFFRIGPKKGRNSFPADFKRGIDIFKYVYKHIDS